MSVGGKSRGEWVEIEFDCLPMRSIGRLDIPIDASPKYRKRCENIKRALEQFGSHNTYYLYNARCLYHLTNDPERGMVEFRFEGVAFTNKDDTTTERCHLEVELRSETCDWLTEPIVLWFREGVENAVCVEFDRYIEAGDLDQTKQRIEQIQSASDQSGGYVGMYL
ncbi:MAG: hypothetical protein QGG36_02800 [Pirellulaceae bacterium]|jgi:hypothetical protein|nr:hypothetical protein [Pirellulaceae bacterium]MDP6721325.1 hypothetical protein [Pirellulaceae bacterium]MDP7014707.1 hypothetical protein [Pirellulaceae bacterium]